MFAILQTTNAIVNKKSIGNDPQPLGNMVDAIAMLAHAHAMLTQFRKEQIKPAIKRDYSAICHLEDQPDSKLLFGDDLAKSLKEAEEASNLSSSMKGYAKPYSSNKKPKQTISII